MLKSPTIERALLVISIIGLLVTARQCSSAQSEKAMLSNDLRTKKDSISYYRLANGTLVAEKESYQLSIGDFKKSILRDKTEEKELTKRIGKLSRLNNELKIQLTVKGDIQLPVSDTLVIVKHDTIKAVGLNFHDRFLTLNGLYLNDSLHLNYQFRTGLDIATYWKENGLFKPRSLVVNVKPDNPHVTITGLDNYAIVEKTKPFYKTNGFWGTVGLIAGFFLFKH
jgi:hypothetical protein